VAVGPDEATPGTRAVAEEYACPMPIRLDHTILEVHDLEASASFYRDIVGLDYEGRRGPFEAFLISADTALDLYDEWPVVGSRHLAFWMDRPTFDATFERIKDSGITYGDGPSRATNPRACTERPTRSTSTTPTATSWRSSPTSGPERSRRTTRRRFSVSGRLTDAT
jgi:catechol 2,3-dioxygenase-like lactoylglutathione lyase family enzyme